MTVLVSAIEPQKDHEDLIEGINRFIDQCETHVGSLTSDVREKVIQLLQDELLLLVGKRANIEVSSNPNENIVTYMADILSIFFRAIAIIDPKSKQIQKFKKMYIDLNQSFIKDMNHSPLFHTLPFEKKKEMIQQAVTKASK